MENNAFSILPHSHPAIDRLVRHRWAATVIGAVSLLGMVAAFAVAPATEKTRVDIRTDLDRLPPPAVSLLEAANTRFHREDRVRRGDTIVSLLDRLGITERDALTFLRSDSQARRLAQYLRPGTIVTAEAGANGELHTLEVLRSGKDATLVIRRGDSGFLAHEEAVEFESRTVVAAGEIHGSLFAATDDAGIPDAVANQLIETLGSEIDFHRDLRKGDRFALIYETLTHRGQTIRSGRLLAAEIRNNQRLLQAYWFQPEHAEGAYYTADGRSLRKAFLLSPIEFSRVTSGFADARLHPILQTWRAHKGVDYAAPTGTRVLPVADGIVEAADFRNGYGKLIVLRHQGAYSTAYGHLDDFAPGIRPGARIRQGDTIGTVGQTGLATGPHLHYEFRVNDEPVDPLAATLPKSSPLDGAQLARHTNSSRARRAQLDLVRDVTLAAME